MKQVTRLKTETQFINRANNERAYTQALHSILFLSRVLNKGNQSYDIGTFRLREGESAPFQYTDTIVLIDGSTRQEFYTALVQKDCIHIKICFAQTHTEDVVDERSADDAYDDNGNYIPTTDEVTVDELEEAVEDWSNLENKGPKVLGQIDLDKCS